MVHSTKSVNLKSLVKSLYTWGHIALWGGAAHIPSYSDPHVLPGAGGEELQLLPSAATGKAGEGIVPDLAAFYPEKYPVTLGKRKPHKFALFFSYGLTLKFSLYILLQTRSCVAHPGIHLPPQFTLMYPMLQIQRP